MTAGLSTAPVTKTNPKGNARDRRAERVFIVFSISPHRPCFLSWRHISGFAHKAGVEAIEGRNFPQKLSLTGVGTRKITFSYFKTLLSRWCHSLIVKVFLSRAKNRKFPANRTQTTFCKCTSKSQNFWNTERLLDKLQQEITNTKAIKRHTKFRSQPDHMTIQNQSSI